MMVARELELKPLARLVDYVQVCGNPTSGTSIPAIAIAKVAKRNGRDSAAWDLIEINEAYAAMPLVSTLVLANGNAQQAATMRMRTNIDSGAVAIGHPLGASGARLVMTLINGLRPARWGHRRSRDLRWVRPRRCSHGHGRLMPIPCTIDIRATARAISCVEDRSAGADELLRKAYQEARHVPIIGITGPPGAGKSTLIDRLAVYWRASR